MHEDDYNESIQYDLFREEIVSDKREITVTAEGLRTFVEDLVSLLTKTKRVEKIAPETGRRYYEMVGIPAEELFSLVEIRNGEDGKFVLRVSPNDLHVLHSRSAINDQIKKYESAS